MASLNTLSGSLFMGALSLAIAGCNGGDEIVDDSGSTDDSGTTETEICDNGLDDDGDALVDEGCADTYDEAVWVLTQFWFGYDAGTDTIRSYDVIDNTGAAFTQSPAAMVRVFTGDSSSVGDELCAYVLEQAGPITPDAAAPPLGDAAVALGFTFDHSVGTLTHNCDGILDPGVFGTDLDAAVENVVWGVGVTGNIDTFLAGQLQTAVDGGGGNYTVEWAPYLWGSRAFMDGTVFFGGSPVEVSFGRTLSVDGSFLAQWNDANANTIWEDTELGTYLITTDVIGATQPNGAYIVQSLFAFGPADQFLLVGADGS